MEPFDLLSFALTRWVADTDQLLVRTRQEIILIDTQTRQPRELLSVKPQRLRSLVPTRDGRTIYFTLEATEADIWLFTLDGDT